jgi:hypothetical protein
VCRTAGTLHLQGRLPNANHTPRSLLRPQDFRSEMFQLVQQAKDGMRHLAPFWKGVKNEAGVSGEEARG